MGTIYGGVVSISDLSRSFRRVVFDVPQLAELGLPDCGDDAVGIYFPAPGEVRPPAMDCQNGVWGYYDAASAPHGRNYSIRSRGPADGQIVCDFVLHERGVASDWVRSAAIGDQVALAHARSWYRPEHTTRWQLLVADLSGLPAVARIIDELPADATATVIVEVADESDLDYLPSRPDVPVISSVGTGNGHAPSALTELVRAHPLPAGRGYCWFAGEAKTSREVRKYFRREHRWAVEQFDIIGYWRFDSETWDRKFEAVSDQVVAVYTQALADGKGDKIATEEYDLALERVGL